MGRLPGYENTPPREWSYTLGGHGPAASLHRRSEGTLLRVRAGSRRGAAYMPSLMVVGFIAVAVSGASIAVLGLLFSLTSGRN